MNPYPESNAPALSTAQMVEVDRLMIETYHIELIQMMENAGRCLADLARRRFLWGDPRGRPVIVLAGPGGNGGGALVCARRLLNWGAEVRIQLSREPGRFTPVPAHQLDILQRMGAAVFHPGQDPAQEPADLIVDGLIGYSLSGAPRGPAADLIRWANDHPAPVLALDAPSGLDAASGTIFDPAIEAAATLTLALPKAGLTSPKALAAVGELYLADISVPPQLYRAPGIELDVGPIFARNDVLRIV